MITKERPVLWMFLALLACGPRQQAPHEASPAPSPGPPQPTPNVSTDAPVILFLGTSLTAGYGLDLEQAFPAHIQARIDAAGLKHRVLNAGVSGETSAGALRRLDWLLQEQSVAVLVVETGANDGLRGHDPEATRANIQTIFDRALRQSPPPRLMLLGMEAPPNLGADYARRFRGIYPELARRNGAVLVPFLLEGVAGIPDLNQADGIHPTAEGHEHVAETVWRALRPLLAS